MIAGGNTSRDGWRLTYSSPQVRVVVEYFDAQFEVRFARGKVVVTYLAIYRELFARRSGYHGDMFSPHELATVVPKIAADIREDYGRLLAGDDSEWDRVSRFARSNPSSSGLP